MFRKTPEKQIIVEADKIASMKESLDALSWDRITEIGKLLQGNLSDEDRYELARELVTISQANTSLLGKLGVSTESFSGKLMPSGIEMLMGRRQKGKLPMSGSSSGEYVQIPEELKQAPVASTALSSAENETPLFVESPPVTQTDGFVQPDPRVEEKPATNDDLASLLGYAPGETAVDGSTASPSNEAIRQPSVASVTPAVFEENDSAQGLSDTVRSILFPVAEQTIVIPDISDDMSEFFATPEPASSSFVIPRGDASHPISGSVNASVDIPTDGQIADLSSVIATEKPTEESGEKKPFFEMVPEEALGSQSGLEPKPEAETMLQSGVVSQSEPLPTFTYQPLIESELEPVSEPALEPAFTYQPVSEPEPASEPAFTYQPETYLEPASEPAFTYQPVSEPEPAFAYQPIVESEPTGQSALAYQPTIEPGPVAAYQQAVEPETETAVVHGADDFDDIGEKFTLFKESMSPADEAKAVLEAFLASNVRPTALTDAEDSAEVESAITVLDMDTQEAQDIKNFIQEMGSQEPDASALDMVDTLEADRPLAAEFESASIQLPVVESEPSVMPEIPGPVVEQASIFEASFPLAQQYTPEDSVQKSMFDSISLDSGMVAKADNSLSSSQIEEFPEGDFSSQSQGGMSFAGKADSISGDLEKMAKIEKRRAEQKERKEAEAAQYGRASKKKVRKQDFARFRQVYASKDGSLCIYEDASGHIIAVDSSKFV